MTFDDMLRQFAIMRAAVLDGAVEPIGEVSKDEALDTVSDFITSFEDWYREGTCHYVGCPAIGDDLEACTCIL